MKRLRQQNAIVESDLNSDILQGGKKRNISNTTVELCL